MPFIQMLELVIRDVVLAWGAGQVVRGASIVCTAEKGQPGPDGEMTFAICTPRKPLSPATALQPRNRGNRDLSN